MWARNNAKHELSSEPAGDMRGAYVLTNCVHELRWDVGTAAPASLGSLDIVGILDDCDVRPWSRVLPILPHLKFNDSCGFRCPTKCISRWIYLSSPTQLKHMSSRHRKRKQEIKVQASASSKEETRMKKVQGEHGNNNHRAVKDIC